MSFIMDTHWISKSFFSKKRVAVDRSHFLDIQYLICKIRFFPM